MQSTSYNSFRVPNWLGLALVVGLVLSWFGLIGLLLGPAHPGLLAVTNPTAMEVPAHEAASSTKTATSSWTNSQPTASVKLTLDEAENLPAGLYSAWLAQQQAEGGAAYNLTTEGESGSSWQATNPAQDLKLEFDNRGVKVNGWGISLSSLGAEKAVEPLVEANRVTYQHPNGLSEWYVNEPSGLEQGFTLTQPLPQTGKDGWLELPVSFEEVKVEANSQAKEWLKLVGAGGEELGQYGKLYASDSNGKVLESELSASGNGQQAVLRVKLAGASYPVVIDPFVQQAELTASAEGTANDYFGSSVALSSDGNTALIGAASKTIGSNIYQGAGYVFTRSGSTWSQQARLTASDGAANDFFGTSVALSSDGNTALVGAYVKKIGSNPGQGAGYVFTRSGSSWSQQARLTASDGGANDQFGSSVALSSDGNTALVGAYAKKIGSNTYQGEAYVFSQSGSSWSQQAELTASAEGTANDYFGSSVALSSDGNTALFGAYGKKIGSNSAQGAGYVFTRSGSSWSQQAELTASDGAANDHFGTSVALSSDGNTALIGASFKTIGSNTYQGAGYVFTRSSSTWSQQARLTASDGAASDYFGTSVALSSDGNTALVGAFGKTIGSNSAQGAAYTFYTSGGCVAPLAVTSVTDDGAGTSCGTLSYALTQATTGQTITFALTAGNTITFTGSLAPTAKVKAGVTIYGGAFGSANRIILNGNMVAGNGLDLLGSDYLVNLIIRKFGGKELVLEGTGNRVQGVKVDAS